MAGIDKTKLEQYRKGELKFTQIFELNGTRMAAVLAAGHNFFSEGRLEEARKIFEGLAVIDPAFPYIQTMLGAIYQKSEKYDLAIARYSMALKLHPNDIHALTNRAETYLMVGKFPEAAEDLKRVLNIDSTQTNPVSKRARMLSALAADALLKVQRERSSLQAQP
jgi:tetratricopeptide (TPR) repeat protein